MSKGKATGPDREYQERCLRFLKGRRRDLRPFDGDGDGIDVPVPGVCGSTVTFDVLLKGADDSVVAAECKRWQKPVPQGEMFSFAKRVEGLREALQTSVAGCFFVFNSAQEGTLRVAGDQDPGIEVIALVDRQAANQEVFRYLSYDAAREQKITAWLAGFNEVLGVEDSVELRLIEDDLSSGQAARDNS